MICCIVGLRACPDWSDAYAPKTGWKCRSHQREQLSRQGSCSPRNREDRRCFSRSKRQQAPQA
eukprot:4952171-Heterocapsa_arctica.AAC.1